jgi:hypothetical protein
VRAEELAPRHLGRRSPPAAWEAYLLIGVFPAGAPLRWCKVQLFSGGRHPGRVCLSALEEMTGPGRRLLLFGREDGVVERDETAFPYGDLRAAAGRWDVSLPGLGWAGALASLELSVETPAVHAVTRSTDVLFWIDLPFVLTYFSAFGEVAVETPWGRAVGLGVVEHAWGADSPFDPRRLAPRAWHWDVLALGAAAGVAGLEVGPRGRRLPLRSGGVVPEVGFVTGRGLRTEVTGWQEQEGRAVPVEWRGELALGARTLRYDARATTRVAPVVPRGGFLGFSFAGELEGRGRTTPLTGSGFCEYQAR